MMRTQKIIVVKLCIHLLESLDFAWCSKRFQLKMTLLYHLRQLLRECSRDQLNEETEEGKRRLWIAFRIRELPLYLKNAWVDALTFRNTGRNSNDHESV